MTTINGTLRLLSIGLLLAGLTSVSFAQAQPQKDADRQQNESTVTGCLTKDASGGYVLADEKTGAKIGVTGPADLEKHAANHKVTLTGTKSDAGGTPMFTVTKIKHVAAECKAPAQ
jgi:hypothetical protein